jgi:hypothetical protein
VTARPTKFFAALLALLVGASGGGASLAACPHATHEERAQVAGHECCHAQHARADARHAESAHANHATADREALNDPNDPNDPKDPRRQSHEASCASHRAGDPASVEPRRDSDAPCADCCVLRLAFTNSPALASARNASRADDAHDTTALRSPTFVPPRRYKFIPTQHAPPAPRLRLHVVNSVLLI